MSINQNPLYRRPFNNLRVAFSKRINLIYQAHHYLRKKAIMQGLLRSIRNQQGRKFPNLLRLHRLLKDRRLLISIRIKTIKV